MTQHFALRGLLLAAVLPSAALADLQYSDFSVPLGVEVVGSAYVAGNFLRLTNPANDETGAAWFQSAQRVSTPWVADFQFQLQGGPGADGFAFVVQNSAVNALGGGGCELGYHGIVNSVAVEFDTFANGSCSAGAIGDGGVPHIGVHTQGTGPNSALESAALGVTAAVPAFSSGAVHQARVAYAPGSLAVYVDDLVNPVLVVALDLATTLNLASERAWIGFTAATGGLNESHDVLSFAFDEDFVAGSGNQSPLQPAITEPAVDWMVVNPGDVHMETSPFMDPDAGDQHLCSDFELWTTSPFERVWAATCATGVNKIHVHLADGLFEGSHAGASELQPGRTYLLRARHRDDSGDAGTEWGPYGQRVFNTGSASNVFPLVAADVVDAPALRWTQAGGGADVVLPAGASPPVLRLDHPGRGMLLQIAGLDGVQNTVTNPAALGADVEVRAVLSGGSTGLALPASDLAFYDDECVRHTLLLPAVNLAPGQAAYWWMASGGSSYAASAAQTTPTFGSLSRGPALPWSLRQPGYEVEVFATGLELPVHLCFKPGAGPEPDAPFLYVTELYGQVKVIARDGTVGTFASGLLDYNPTGLFPGSGEQGVSGIAVDPVSGDVFVSMLYDSPSSPGTHYPKVVRFTSNDGGRTAASATTILNMPGESQGQSHFISTLTMHPGSKLLVHMGDGFTTSTAQNLSSFRGKILRINLDGTPATNNPFYDAGDGISARDYVYAYGVRNPFGGAWRALDGRQYTVENGPSVDRIGKVLPGRNFGWNGSDASMSTFALYTWNPAHGPVSIAFVQPETFGGSGFPAEKQGHAFVSESGPTYAPGGQALGKRVTEFVFDANGDLVGGPFTLMEYVGQGRETSVGLAAGPDGLYMTTLYDDAGPNPIAAGGRILRVSATPGWDCNQNGVDDACDVASGVERDLDGNGLPDSCDCAGVSFCSATVNSTGAPAHLGANGQCVLAQNALVLDAQPVPNGPGVFFAGQNQVNGGAGVPFYNGLRCVGGAVVRFPVVVASGGVATQAVDFTSAPGDALHVGETWHFQYWFRDVAGGGTSVNLSDGLTLSIR
ncbi:MAG: PQQ-dependent sugar dehydrogenase [Planctomycetes bacterium]|nr:PQQ-dependent sugar dehydrogenase [Planctomycetota bacterium]